MNLIQKIFGENGSKKLNDYVKGIINEEKKRNTKKQKRHK